MTDRDRFGRTMSPSLLRRMKQLGDLLVAVGYRESKGKPHLFLRKSIDFVFFVDMRGTREVSMSEIMMPLLYWRFHDDVPNWLRRRLIKDELNLLYEKQCPCRLSFHAYSAPEFDSVSVAIDEEQGIYDWPDGRCIVCGEDFRNEGIICSTDCQREYDASLTSKCEICGCVVHAWDGENSANALPEPCAVCGEPVCVHSAVAHHTTYFPEVTILIHRGCHNQIHRTDRFPHLKPSKTDIDRFYRKR